MPILLKVAHVGYIQRRQVRKFLGVVGRGKTVCRTLKASFSERGLTKLFTRNWKEDTKGDPLKRVALPVLDGTKEEVLTCVD